MCIRVPTYHLGNQVFLDSFNMPTSHSECDRAGLGQHQGTVWVCNLTELGKCRITETRH